MAPSPPIFVLLVEALSFSCSCCIAFCLSSHLSYFYYPFVHCSRSLLHLSLPIYVCKTKGIVPDNQFPSTPGPSDCSLPLRRSSLAIHLKSLPTDLKLWTRDSIAWIPLDVPRVYGSVKLLPRPWYRPSVWNPRGVRRTLGVLGLLSLVHSGLEEGPLQT